MNKKRLTTFLIIFILVFFIIFVLITQILAVPLWWIFGFLHPLSVVGPSKLLVKVSPETPLNIGEKITVTVMNSSNQLPVEDAKVSAVKDSMNITIYTDSNGQASFEYFGEVTVIVAQKAGIDSSDPIAIPKTPDIWVTNTLISFGSAIFGSLITVFGTYIIQKRTARRR